MNYTIFESAIDNLEISDIHKDAIKQLHKVCYEGGYSPTNFSDAQAYYNKKGSEFQSKVGNTYQDAIKAVDNAKKAKASDNSFEQNRIWDDVKKAEEALAQARRYSNEMNADETIRYSKEAKTYADKALSSFNAYRQTIQPKQDDGKKEESPKKTTPTNQTQNSKPKAVLPKLPIDDVKLVQALLNEKKNVGLTEDGKMGPKTMKAIQRTEDLNEDGKWGPRTKEAYQSLLAEAKKAASETKGGNEPAAPETPKQMSPEERGAGTNRYGNLLTAAIQKSIGEDFNTAQKIANNINMDIIRDIKKKKNDQYIIDNIKVGHKLSKLSNDGWNAIQALITHHRKANNIPEENNQDQTKQDSKNLQELQAQAHNILLNVWREKKANGDAKLKNATELQMKKNALAKVKKWDKEQLENYIAKHSQDNNPQQSKPSNDTIKSKSNESELETPPTPSDKKAPPSRKQEFKIGINGVEGDDGVPFETAKKNYSHTFESNLKSLYSTKSKGYSEKLDKQIRKEFHKAIGEYAVRNTGDITNLLQHLIEMNGGEVKSEQMLYDKLQLAIRSCTKDYATYVKSYEAMKKEK